MDCGSVILSEDTYEFIVAEDEAIRAKVKPLCRQKVGDQFEIWYYDRRGLPSLSVETYSYGAIPKPLGLLSSTSLENSGILRVQNQPTLSLKGQGVFVAVIDTGVNIYDKAFRDSAGGTRVFSLWDQTGEEGTPPEGFLYGREYTKGEIDELLLGEDFAVRENGGAGGAGKFDADGHGTFLASVACGSPDVAADFIGAAPEAELLVVKLKTAKSYLKDYFFIPKEEVCYGEADIMTAVAYVKQVALRERRPLVIFLGLGCNNGNHDGSSALSRFLSQVANEQEQVVVTATGNEANNRHHFFGQSISLLAPLRVEINVERDMRGFYGEFWALAPQIFSVALQSPTGEVWPPNPPVAGGSLSHSYIFEGSRLTLDYRNIGNDRENQLIFFRLENARRGIWTLLIYPQNVFDGSFHIWLPMAGLLEGDVFFLQPSPQNTLTMPSDGQSVISVGGYNGENGALYLESGRGYSVSGGVKPDFLAPAVKVQGKGVMGNDVAYSGTSAASAITAGACAQVLEWAVVKEGYAPVNSVRIRNFLIRGCRRNPEQIYPSPAYGADDIIVSS